MALDKALALLSVPTKSNREEVGVLLNVAMSGSKTVQVKALILQFKYGINNLADQREAVRLTRFLAKQNDSWALNELIYLEAYRVEENDHEAPLSSTQIANTNRLTIKPIKSSEGVNDIVYKGFIYEVGQNVPKDIKRAANYYIQAANQGSSYAAIRLGVMSLFGDGLPKDAKKAVRWYVHAYEAADGYEGEAASGLGYLYSHEHSGEPTKLELEEAISWYRRAVNLGQKDAQESLSELTK